MYHVTVDDQTWRAEWVQHHSVNRTLTMQQATRTMWDGTAEQPYGATYPVVEIILGAHTVATIVQLPPDPV